MTVRTKWPLYFVQTWDEASGEWITQGRSEDKTVALAIWAGFNRQRSRLRVLAQYHDRYEEVDAGREWLLYLESGKETKGAE